MVQVSAKLLITILVAVVLVNFTLTMQATEQARLDAALKLASAVVGFAVAVSGAVTAIGAAVRQAGSVTTSDATLVGVMTVSGALLVLASAIR